MTKRNIAVVSLNALRNESLRILAEHELPDDPGAQWMLDQQVRLLFGKRYEWFVDAYQTAIGHTWSEGTEPPKRQLSSDGGSSDSSG